MAVSIRNFLFCAALGLLAACAGARAGDPGHPQPKEAVLLSGGFVVDPAGAGPPARADVLIIGDRIAAVGLRLRVPAAARRIDVGGAHLVPGLWDMHAHVAAVGATGDALEDYIRHGVLGIRDMGGRIDELLRLRSEIAAGTRLGLTMVVAGPTLNGEEAADFHRLVRNGDEARAAVRELAARGVDFIKIHRQISRDAFDGLREQAGTERIVFGGHVPLAMKWDEAANLGMRTMEHIQTIVENELERGGDPVRATFEALHRLDGRRGDEIFAAMARNRTHWTPSLIFYETSWRTDPPARQLLKQRAYARMVPLVLRASRAGVPILAGTDLLERRGEGLLDELDRLVRAGLTPRQAMAAATTTAFALTGRGPGPIRAGGEASLLALACDPLAEIACVRRQRMVVLRGQVVARSPGAPAS